MKSAILCLGIIISSALFAQVSEKYDLFVKQADSLYNSKNYSASAQKYSDAFWSNDGKAVPSHRYNAACSWALANVKDSAFYHLFRLAESISKYNNYQHISTDADLKSLYTDSRWEELLIIVKRNKDEFEKDFDKPLVAILDSIHDEDQKYRIQIDEVEEKYGRESEEMRNHWKKIQQVDSINLIIVSKILDERGWLGSKVVGNKGNSTLFLVVQHADSATQVKYLPMMREAVKEGRAYASSLALLEDRLALRQGKKQIYGSQIGFDKETEKYIVQDLEDPDNVDKRRAEVGLPPLADYVKNWNIVWNVAEYKKNGKKNFFNSKE